jgi:divalent metal cation (Fe/Co/Zn/Cd) transporter
MRINAWLISIDGYIDYLATIVIVKYLYKINWLKAIGALVIPLGSIYLLSQFFAEYVL